jgi:16S rRNA (uracil1498-N3)-methyltransferase
MENLNFRNHKIRSVYIKREEQTPYGLQQKIKLTKEKSKHLFQVLRMQNNQTVRLVDGLGFEYLAKIIEDKSINEIFLEIVKVGNKKPESLPIVVILCHSKNSTMDFVIEKITECGVTDILPVCSSRSVVRISHKESDKYLKRWNKIIEGAIELSERVYDVNVFSPCSWSEVFECIKENFSNYEKLACVSEIRDSSQELNFDFKESVNKFLKYKEKPVCVLIGPEGGLTDEERVDLREHGFHEVLIHENTLSVESAAISVVSLINFVRVLNSY